MKRTKCKYCGSPETNRGILKRYGPYVRFQCRTYYNNKITSRGSECIRIEKTNSINNMFEQRVNEETKKIRRIILGRMSDN